MFPFFTSLWCNTCAVCCLRCAVCFLKLLQSLFPERHFACFRKKHVFLSCFYVLTVKLIFSSKWNIVSIFDKSLDTNVYYTMHANLEVSFLQGVMFFVCLHSTSFAHPQGLSHFDKGFIYSSTVIILLMQQWWRVFDLSFFFFWVTPVETGCLHKGHCPLKVVQAALLLRHSTVLFGVRHADVMNWKVLFRSSVVPHSCFCSVLPSGHVWSHSKVRRGRSCRMSMLPKGFARGQS